MAKSTIDVQPRTEVSKELYMLSNRDDVEKDRLNEQSSVIRAVRDGHVLDPSIPKDKISRIADIATGTGVWLNEVVAELEAAGCKTPETVGFDISAEQFPKTANPRMKFAVWDAKTSFPAEYQGAFDIVHVRLLTVAVTIEEIGIIANNLVDLIKPGGYLQWTDWTYTNGRKIIYPPGDSELSLEREGEEMYKFHGEQKFSYDTTGEVAKALKSSTMEVVRVTDHTGASRRKPELRSAVAHWHSRVIPLFMDMMARRQGNTADEAKVIAENYRRKALEMHKRGTIFEVPINTLVARKRTIE